MKNAHILVIEDEQDIRDLICFQVMSRGHKVTALESADKALPYLSSTEKIDLFIIDWMLPGQLNGLDFTKKIRKSKTHKEVPVIMLTALTQAENIVAGLDAGADDYITKPFDLSVLDARVRVQLRSSEESLENTRKDRLFFGLVMIEKEKCRVRVKDEEVVLTSTEYKILLLLAEKPGHVFTRAQLINNILGENVFVTGRTIDTHIAGLRKKLGEASDMIETIRGIGYRFREDGP